MNNSTMAFRCAVAPEISQGTLKLGNKRFDIRVIDTSREAFTVEIKPCHAKGLREGRRAQLKFNDETWIVECSAIHQLMSGRLSATMARVRDLTQVRGPKTTLWSLLPIPNPTADPVLPLALLMSFIFACVALPGMGDTLGTAPKIRKVVQDVWRKTTGY